MDEKEAARKYAVKNAYEHGGKAQIGAVVGKAKALFPEKEIKELMPAIKSSKANTKNMKQKDGNSSRKRKKKSCPSWSG